MFFTIILYNVDILSFDSSNGTTTSKKLRKCIQYIQDFDESEKIKIEFSSIIDRPDKMLQEDIRQTNNVLNNYCSNKVFVYVDNFNRVLSNILRGLEIVDDRKHALSK